MTMPMIESGTVSQMISVTRSELKRKDHDEDHHEQEHWQCPRESCLGPGGIFVFASPLHPVAGRQRYRFDLLAHAPKQSAGKSGRWIGMDRYRRESIPSHDDGILQGGGKSDTTCLTGINRPATGLKICTSRKRSGFARSACRSAGHNRKQFVTLAINTDRPPTEGRRERRPKIGASDSSQARLRFRKHADEERVPVRGCRC